MTKGTSLTKEDMARGGRNGRKHGMKSVAVNGEEALAEDERSLFIQIQESLRDEQGVYEQALESVSLGYVMELSLVSYIQKETASGTPLEELKCLGFYTRLKNSNQRGLKMLKELKPDEAPESTAELDKIDKVLDATT